MKKTLAIAAFAALLSAGAASTATAASAQMNTGAPVQQVDFRGHHKDWRHQQRILPKRVIIRSLYRRGYRDIRHVRRVRGDYVLIARGYRGTVKLVVDGHTARILARHLLHRNHRPGFTFHGGNGNFSYSFGIR